MLSHLAAFAGLAAVLVAIPGPSVMLIMKNAVIHGRRTAMLIAFGVFSGDLVWVAASVTGLTALLVASRPAFETLRYIGAAYLIYLGGRLLIRGLPAAEDAASEAAPPRASKRAYLEGALCELSNPKALLVFTSVIPQFVPATSGAIELMLFGGLFATLGMLSLIVYATVLGTTHRLVGQSRLGSALVRLGGAALAGFGIDLAIDPIT